MKFAILIVIISTLSGCCNRASNLLQVVVNADSVVTRGYVGTGAQWGGYGYIAQFTGSAKLTAEDWNTLCKRVDFMRPGFIRLMGGQGWNYAADGNPAVSEDVVTQILDYCQRNNITVVYGEWGHQGGDSAIDDRWLNRAVNYLDWLVNDKKYSCIKYYMLVNEPNGFWSSIDGNYPLWQSLVRGAHSKLTARGLLEKVEFMGPDIAYWNNPTALEYREPWINTTVRELGDKITAYDIHAYPGHCNVRSGMFSQSLDTLLREIPADRRVFMTELGGKYPDEPKYDAQNKDRQKSDPYTSDNTNLFTYDAFYAIDMADAVIQCMNAGIDGVAMWDMDDAMYCAYEANGTATRRLHRWGFWNILASEIHDNPADENIRPWFYTISLLSRYIPAGSNILKVDTPGVNLRVVAAERDGRYTIALVNPSAKEQSLELRLSGGAKSEQMSIFRFIAGNGGEFIADLDGDGLAVAHKQGVKVDLKRGYRVTLAPSSFMMLTSIE